jgi:hypothetical protein
LPFFLASVHRYTRLADRFKTEVLGTLFSVFDINPSEMGHEFAGAPPGTINPLDEPTSTPLLCNTATEGDPRLRRTPDE